MDGLILPDRFNKSGKYPFEELAKSKEDATRVLRAMCSALERSFANDERQMGLSFRQKIENETEVKRRTNIMCGWYRTMRAECGYSTSKAISYLYAALMAELSGGRFEPPENKGLYAAESMPKGVLL